MLQRIARLTRKSLRLWLSEALIFVAFLAFTAVLTWPWVIHLRDAVSDTGDPYMIAWTLWWDYHQTFRDPFNLFHANIFYPYRYTLAFSEHDYGIALLFFPLYAIGMRPLSVHSLATFLGFAFCGYGAFRLTRTLTGSSDAAWVAGVVFAFIPFRFQLLSHLHYLFAGWIPLLLEALVLFARLRSWRRAAWLGTAFLMNALSCTTWLILTLLPLTMSTVFLVVCYRLLHNREFWLRGLLVISVASLLLLPFLWPYYKVHQLYGFQWPPEEALKYSAKAADWLSAVPRNKFWNGFGQGLPDVKNNLFPGLLPLLLALAGLLLVKPGSLIVSNRPANESPLKGRRWIHLLDATWLMAGLVAILAGGLKESDVGFFRGATLDRSLAVLFVALLARLAISNRQLFQSQPEDYAGLPPKDLPTEGFWLGVIWMVIGFLGSFGPYFFFNRVINEALFLYGSLRVPARAAMICYVGLAVLAGVGALRLAQLVSRRYSYIKYRAIMLVIVGALLFELNAAPLDLVLGAADPDALALHLKQTPMRGGLVELPAVAPGFPLHLAMLRSADHERPLVNAASTFISPLTVRIAELTAGPGISQELLDLLEEIPTSYVVIRRGFIPQEQQGDFESFLSAAVVSDRLRLVGRFGDDDLYSVVKNEPEAQRIETKVP